MKILQWLFGSFFRTIGRTIAILVMGGLLYYILSINGIGISDLFLDNVKASEIRVVNTNYYTDSSRTTIWPEISNAPTYYGQNFGTVYGARQFLQFFMPNIAVNNENKVKFRVYNTYSGLAYENYTASIIGYIDTNNGSYWCTTQQVDTQANFVETECDIPITTTTITGVYFFTIIRIGNPTAISFGLNPTITFYKDTNVEIKQVQQQQLLEMQAQTNAINSQTQQQQQHHQEIMDSNTTQADNIGKDFITNFSNNNHGLTGIITAPLNAIQSLSSATCSPLILPLPFTNNKTLTLPCMSNVYSQYFGAFYTMYQGIILGLISYWVCVRIFALAKGFKDPEDDKIEVVDL